MPTPDELQGQIDSLTQRLNAALNRISDLEDFAGDHLGLDWGESLVDANSPHPNISVNTIESGGGTIRQDTRGIQVNGSSGDTVAVFFVPYLSTSPSTVFPSSYFYGNTPSSLASASSGVVAYGPSQGTVTSLSQNANSVRGRTIINAGVGADEANLTVIVDTNSGEKLVKIDGVSFRLPSSGSDFSYVENGCTLYRTDTHKFRGTVNGTTMNFLMDGDALAFSADISPAQITANQNDYAPTGLSGASVLRLNTDAARDITGLTGGSDGRVLLIFNVGSFNIVLKDESASSTAANRFALNGDITLQPDNSVGLWYDSTSTRWRAF